MNLMLIHGFGGCAGDWNQFLEHFDPNATTIRPSLPGHGGKDDVCSHGAIEAWVGAQEVPRNTVVMGYSMGGRMAALLAKRCHREGNPLKGLVMISAGLGFSSEEARNQRRIDDQLWASLLREHPDRFWAEWYSQDLFSTFQAGEFAGKTAWLRARESLSGARLAEALADLSPAAHEPLGPVLAGQIGAPLLYIAGEKDKKYAAAASQIQTLVPGATVKIIPGVGHVIPVEAPEALARTVRNFLDS